MRKFDIHFRNGKHSIKRANWMVSKRNIANKYQINPKHLCIIFSILTKYIFIVQHKFIQANLSILLFTSSNHSAYLIVQIIHLIPLSCKCSSLALGWCYMEQTLAIYVKSQRHQTTLDRSGSFVITSQCELLDCLKCHCTACQVVPVGRNAVHDQKV